MGLMDAPQVRDSGFPWVSVIIGMTVVVGLILAIVRMSGS